MFLYCYYLFIFIGRIVGQGLFKKNCCVDMPGDSAALNVRAPDHVDEVHVAVARAQLNVAPRPLRPVVRILILAIQQNPVYLVPT